MTYKPKGKDMVKMMNAQQNLAVLYLLVTAASLTSQ